MMNKVGRIEKTVDAHKGAVLSARWSADGSALLTCESPPPQLLLQLCRSIKHTAVIQCCNVVPMHHYLCFLFLNLVALR